MNTLAELAELIGGAVRGEASLGVNGITTLGVAGPQDLSFLSSRRYRDEARSSRAAALLVAAGTVPADDPLADKNLLETEDLPAALARLVGHFHPARETLPGVHATAVVAADAEVDESASIGPQVVIGARSRIGAEVVLEAQVSVGEDCVIGRGTHLYPQVALYSGCRIGQRVIVHAGTVVGSDGFGYASSTEGHQKIPQVGTVEIEDDVEIGANCTIDRASLDVTRIGAGTKIDNLVQVGHNVTVGEHCLLVSQSGIAGSTALGRFVVVAGQSGVSGHIRLGDGVKVAAKSAVFQEVEAGKEMAGIPAVELGSWRRQQALVRRLPELRSRLRKLERQSNEH